MFQPPGQFQARPEGALLPHSDGPFARELSGFTAMLNQPAKWPLRCKTPHRMPLNLPAFDHGQQQTNSSRPSSAEYHRDNSASSPPLSAQSPFSSYSEPTSRGQSIAPHNRAPPSDYCDTRGYSVPHTPNMTHQSPLTFHNPAVRSEMMATQSLQNTMQLVFEELQRMNLRVSGLEEVNQTLLPSQQQLTERVGGTEEAVIRIEALLAVSHENTTNKTGSSKNISNQHPHLKNVVHPMLFNLCGIDKATAGDQAELIEMLCSQGELPGTEAFMVVGGKNVWRPRWKEAINGKVNGLFLTLIQSLRNTPGSKPELDDADYKKSVIMSMAKSYFRNIADQVGKQSNQRKQERHLKKQIATRRRGFSRLLAVVATQLHNLRLIIKSKVSPPWLTPTLSPMSCLGKGAKMTVRLEWRSLIALYVVFLRVLDSIQKRGNVSVAVPAAGSADATTATTTAVTGPPSKRRKVGKKDVHKNNFDTHPSKMSTRTPDSQKAIPTIPFRGMMNTAWLSANPSTTVLDGMTWLEDFHKRAKEGDLTPEDREYLEELATWIAEHADDEGGSAEAEVSGV